jgi:hypothetical protein
MKCAACGAQLGPVEVACSFCGVVTPFGLQQQQLLQHQAAQAHAFHAHREHEQTQRKQHEASVALKRGADAALFWGIGGLVGCFCFIPSVVAIVLGFRSRTMARRYNLVIPTNATLGLVLGAVGILGGAGLITIGVVEDMRRDSSLSEIEQQLEGKLQRPTIDQASACLLVRRSLLKGEYKDSNSTVDGFSCDGKLTLQGDKGVLDDVRFKRSSERHVVRACLTRGERWTVGSFRDGNASCDEAPATAPPAAVSTAKAAGSARAVPTVP